MGVEPVPLSNGQRAQFTSVDGLVSFLATGDAWLASEFERAMSEHRSGLTEIDYGEFNKEYLEKKNNAPISRPPWREELSKNNLIQSQSLTERLLSAQGVVGAASSPPPAPPPSPSALSHAPQAAVNAQIAQALPTVADYKPEVGKRKKAKT